MVDQRIEDELGEEGEPFEHDIDSDYKELLREAEAKKHETTESEGERMSREYDEFMSQEEAQRETQRQKGRQQVAEDAYREQVQEEKRGQGVGREETHREEIDRLMREEEERMKREHKVKRDEEMAELKLKIERERLKAAKRASKGESPKGGLPTVRKVVTLGGPVRMNEATRHLYIAGGLSNRVKPNMQPYDLSGMKGLTAPGGLSPQTKAGGLSKLREATMPQPMKGHPDLGLTRHGIDLSRLRSASVPQPMKGHPDLGLTRHGVDLSGLRSASVNLSRLRVAGALGTSPIAQYARQSTQQIQPMPVSQPAARQVNRFTPASGGAMSGLQTGERVVKSWPRPVWFLRMSDVKNVIGHDVHLTKLRSGNYAFRAVDDETFEGLYRIIGKRPPKESDTFGPLKIKGKAKR